MYYLYLLVKKVDNSEFQAFINSAILSGLIICNEGAPEHEFHMVNSSSNKTEMEFGIKEVSGDDLEELKEKLNTLLRTVNNQTKVEIVSRYIISEVPIFQDLSEGYR